MAAELLTASELASLLRVSTARIYQLSRENRLPGAVHLGRQLRWRRSEIDLWLANGGTALNGGWRREPLEPRPAA